MRIINIFHIHGAGRVPPVSSKPLNCTCVMGGFGGPGAMKATVEAVALLATTGSLISRSTCEILRRLRTVQTPCDEEN